MANWQVISLDTTTPQLRAPGTGDGYSFNSGSTTLGTWTTIGLTLSTGTLTVSSGTANGVLYLNGSKVATSGSAFAFNGTDLTLPAECYRASATSFVRLSGGDGVGSGANLILFGQTHATAPGRVSVNAVGTGHVEFSTGGGVRATLDSSGNLGIGTTSPGARLDVQAALLDMRCLSTTGTNYVRQRMSNTGGDFYYGIDGSAGGNFGVNYGAVLWYTGNYPMVFATNNSIRACIAATGEVGIGTTNPQAKLHVAAGNISVDNNRAFSAFDNAGTQESILSVSTANNLTIASPTLSGSIQYAVRNASGIHQFFIGGTDRMRLDSSGRLLVGGTSAVVGSANGSIEVQNANTNLMGLTSFTAASSGPNLFFSKSRGATVGTNTIVQSGDTVGAFVFRGANGTGYDDAAYIIGSVDGTPGASADMPGRLSFWTSADGSASPTERMRITSAGDVGIGNTNPLYRLTVDKNTTSALAFFTNSNATSPNGLYIDFSAASPDNNTQYFFVAEDSTAVRCYIYSDGDLANHDGVYGTISDQRLKQDIVDAPSQWDDLKAVRFRKYRMKTDVQANPDSPAMLGVVAQELEAVCPGLVDEHTDKDGEITKTVKSSILLMKAAVALQEAMARIEKLEAEVSALKGA